jgi:hypothetical protein
MYCEAESMEGTRHISERNRDGQTWLAAFFGEVISMPRRHVMVFVVTTVLLLIVEVELIEGWHLVHIAELVGIMVFLYLMWAAWRTGSRRTGA